MGQKRRRPARRSGLPHTQHSVRKNGTPQDYTDNHMNAGRENLTSQTNKPAQERGHTEKRKATYYGRSGREQNLSYRTQNVLPGVRSNTFIKVNTFGDRDTLDEGLYCSMSKPLLFANQHKTAPHTAFEDGDDSYTNIIEETPTNGQRASSARNGSTMVQYTRTPSVKSLRIAENDVEEVVLHERASFLSTLDADDPGKRLNIESDCDDCGFSWIVGTGRRSTRPVVKNPSFKSGRTDTDRASTRTGLTVNGKIVATTSLKKYGQGGICSSNVVSSSPVKAALNHAECLSGPSNVFPQKNQVSQGYKRKEKRVEEDKFVEKSAINPALQLRKTMFSTKRSKTSLKLSSDTLACDLSDEPDCECKKLTRLPNVQERTSPSHMPLGEIIGHRLGETVCRLRNIYEKMTTSQNRDFQNRRFHNKKELDRLLANSVKTEGVALAHGQKKQYSSQKAACSHLCCTDGVIIKSTEETAAASSPILLYDSEQCEATKRDLPTSPRSGFEGEKNAFHNGDLSTLRSTYQILESRRHHLLASTDSQFSQNRLSKNFSSVQLLNQSDHKSKPSWQLDKTHDSLFDEGKLSETWRGNADDCKASTLTGCSSSVVSDAETGSTSNLEKDSTLSTLILKSERSTDIPPRCKYLTDQTEMVQQLNHEAPLPVQAASTVKTNQLFSWSDVSKSIDWIIEASSNPDVLVLAQKLLRREQYWKNKENLCQHNCTAALQEDASDNSGRLQHHCMTTCLREESGELGFVCDKVLYAHLPLCKVESETRRGSITSPRLRADFVQRASPDGTTAHTLVSNQKRHSERVDSAKLREAAAESFVCYAPTDVTWNVDMTL